MATEAEQSATSDTFTASLKDAITPIGGITALLAALFWYVGRSYLTGYYAALNILISQITLTLWDYGEFAWDIVVPRVSIPLIIVSYVLFGLRRANETLNDSSSGSSIAFTIFLIVQFGVAIFAVLVIMHIIKMSPSTESSVLLILYTLAVLSFIMDREIIYMVQNILFMRAIFTIDLLIVVALSVATSVDSAYDRGYDSGVRYVTRRAPYVQLVVKDNVLTGVVNPTPVVSNNKTIYIYDTLHFLIYNDQRYFLYDAVDTSCEPTRVYVVKEEDIRSIQYTMGPPLKADCIPIATPTTTPSLILPSPSTLP